MRIRRHDALVKYIGKSLEKEDYSTSCEQLYKLENGSLKPDLIATRGHTSFVLDSQILSDQANLDKADDLKKKKYADRADLLDAIKTKTGADTIKVLGITLNWSKQSAEALIELGIIQKKQLKVIYSRTIIGGLAIYNQFEKSLEMVKIGGVRVYLEPTKLLSIDKAYISNRYNVIIFTLLYIQ